MIGAAIMALVVLLMILVLLFPKQAQDIQMSAVPKGARPDPNRSGMRLVPSVVIFIFGIGTFRMWDRALHGLATPSFSSAFGFRAFLIVGGFFLILGLWGANWPMSFMERMAPGLRGRLHSLGQAGADKVVSIGKCFAVICLLVAALSSTGG